MKLSDYVAQFLVNNKIQHLFTISGGGIMHLLDSVSRQDDLEVIYNLNEQATGICAESYGQFTNHLGACLVTTGPGATNAVTGCAGAWLDSTPVMYISGQTKTKDMGQLKGLRQFGAQEIAIIPMVKNITKYSVTILDKNLVKYHLEKAAYLATHGRKGPVWIDIPLDIQAEEIDVDMLMTFDPIELEDEKNIEEDIEMIHSFYKHINASKKPVILMGHGVVASGKAEAMREIIRKFQIPVLSTWRVKGLFDDEDAIFFGHPGSPAPRYSNYILQNSDMLIIMGSRLNPAITAYSEENFAPKAKKIIIDIDEKELDKFTMDFEMKIHMDLGVFIEQLIQKSHLYKEVNRHNWFTYCHHMKKKYPLMNEVQPYNNEGKVDGYTFSNALSSLLCVDDIIIGSSSGRTCGISHMAIKLQEGQKFISSMGIGSMGWCVPSAIACCIASGKKRTIVLEGDGSLQHNVQELALIKSHKLPIKLFVFSNNGYASIFAMQRNNFHENYAGCHIQSGLYLPKVKSIAQTYGIKYRCIHSNDEIGTIIKEIMDDNGSINCEIKGSINFDEIPKSQTTINPDGSFQSSKLEYLFPFIDVKEHEQNMNI